MAKEIKIKKADLLKIKKVYQNRPISETEIGKMFCLKRSKIQKLVSKYGWKRNKGIKDGINKNKANKIKRTNLEKYGVENVFQLKETKDKIKKTMLKKYGVENANYSIEIQNKKTKNCLKKYGVKNPSMLPSNREKAKQTMLKKYGVGNYAQTEEYKNKIKQTNLEKYGVEYVSQNKKIKEKTKQTILERYGVDNPLKNKKIYNKAKRTMLEKYGVDNISKNKIFQQKKIDTNRKKYGVDYYLQSKEAKIRIAKTNQKKYGVDWFCMTKKAMTGMRTENSKPNKEFGEKLKKNKIKFKTEYPIKNRVYDFIAGNILIEINPSATHNINFSIRNNGKLKTKTYHQEKSRLAEQNGYHCIHIWDWDDENKIIELFLKSKEKVYARNTEIKEIDKKIANEFLGQYHLQGACRGNEINIGLYDKKNTLIQVMTFGKPRYNKNYEYELLRLCSSKQVIGGNEKLFKYFLETYKPKSIISYCDSSKFTGEVYKKLGFILKSDQPSKHWYNIKTKRHITDNELRRLGFDKLLGANYGKGTSNEELMKQHGFWEIYDAGQQVWVLKM